MSVLLETPVEIYLRKDFVITSAMLDGLSRINQTGAEHAQQALAGLLAQKGEVSLEATTILPLTMLARRLQESGRVYIGCHVRIFGEIQAELYCYLERGQARVLAEAVLKTCPPPVNPRARSRLVHAALAELANVLVSAYWRALHGHVPLDWRTTAPAVVDNVERVFTLASRIGHYDSVVFHTDFRSTGPKTHLFFCLIPGLDCLNRFLAHLDAGRLHPLV
ncbi:MAG: hypothetical protein ACM3X6_12180 [Patescibacteria group bacterium]